MIMNRLTMLAVTLMASMACFAQGKMTTGMPGAGLQVGEKFDFYGVKYEVLGTTGTGNVYRTKAIGLETSLLENYDLADGEDMENALKIQHYVAPSNPSWGMIVESVETDAFKTVPQELAAKLYKLVIDYSDDDFVNGAIVSLPTTGNTFAGLTGLIEVKSLIPGAKVAAISTDAFATSVFNNASLIVPDVSMGKYAKLQGWKKFASIYNTEEELFGDINGNGSVAGNDVTALKRVIAGTRAETDACDVNSNGSVAGNDVTALKRVVAGTY